MGVKRENKYHYYNINRTNLMKKGISKEYLDAELILESGL